MARRIQTGSPATLQKGAEGSVSDQDDFLARLVKYIPSEIVGLYVAASGFVPRMTDNKPNPALWWVFTPCAILTPIYLGWVTRDPAAGKGPLWVQVLFATIAFPVWVFALGGPFELLSWYNDKRYVASLVLVFVTTVFGWYKPAPGS
jgi:hypothetical protein